MKKVSSYITEISIKEGPVCRHRPGEISAYLETDNNKEGWAFSLLTELMVPNEWLSLMLCSEVKLSTLTLDEDNQFYDLGQYIITDKLIALKVRQFITEPVINFNKKINFKGFVLADLEF